MANPFKKIKNIHKDETILDLVHFVENLAAKILSLALLIIILWALLDLVFVLYNDVFSRQSLGSFNKTLIEIFGLFLDILIALELLENITGYLKKHVFQLELVLVTALIAVARKIIVFDLDKKSSNDVMALAVATLCLSLGYAIVRLSRVKKD